MMIRVVLLSLTLLVLLVLLSLTLLFIVGLEPWKQGCQMCNAYAAEKKVNASRMRMRREYACSVVYIIIIKGHSL